MDRALGLVREVPDFPEPGVLFRDLSPVLADAAGFRAVTDAFAAALPSGAGAVDTVVAIEARGFLFGAALATAAGLGLVAVRKPGKLPAVADRVTYDLEYGSATLELPADTLAPGSRVVIVDDVLATGGTVEAAAGLVERAGATTAVVAVVVELTALGGRSRLPGGADFVSLLSV
ncbi:adenine phosphoribosyltransferase [Actinokineospora bangkokensis]|uniref:Adenine phosphoribosyltransferase n=1 Tax=Actinokineospora bangkokensis TaxID=1193682 RepID=A0A1Q9LS73_9PSEU|nr:adenine phosphoribosyltransferase [Actinokineospora bangkokensis]